MLYSEAIPSQQQTMNERLKKPLMETYEETVGPVFPADRYAQLLLSFCV